MVFFSFILMVCQVNRGFRQKFPLHKKSSVPAKRDEAYPRYHPDSRNIRALFLFNAQHTSLPTDIVQKCSSGAKLKNYLNLRKLTAGGFLSLKENNFLKTPSWPFLF